MTKLRYVIYKIDKNDNVINNCIPLNGKIYKEINDVAMDLINIDNERLNDILKEMCNVAETLEDVDIEEFIFDILTCYTLKLARRIKKYFLGYLTQNIPIDDIPNFEYLDKLCVNVFAID